MDLESLQPAFKTLIETISELETVWEDEPRPFVDPMSKAICLLTITASAERGTGDDRKTNQDLTKPQGEELADTFTGLREVTLSAKIESYDQSPGFTGRQYAERIRNGMKWRSSQAVLNGLGCSVIRVMDPVDLSETRDDHRVSIVAVDVRLNVMLEHSDPVRYGYVTRVVVNGPWASPPPPGIEISDD
jgi:hypothetical protein